MTASDSRPDSNPDSSNEESASAILDAVLGDSQDEELNNSTESFSSQNLDSTDSCLSSEQSTPLPSSEGNSYGEDNDLSMVMADIVAAAAVENSGPEEEPFTSSDTKVRSGSSTDGSIWKILFKGALWTGIFGTTAVISAAVGAALVLSVPMPWSKAGTPSEGVSAPLPELWQSGFQTAVFLP